LPAMGGRYSVKASAKRRHCGKTCKGAGPCSVNAEEFCGAKRKRTGSRGGGSGGSRGKEEKNLGVGS